MRVPVIQGVIDRRVLVNYRVSPDVIAPILPRPFRPKLIDGYAIAGICLIRLRDIRPKALPVPIGITSENAAHRIAVEWDDAGERREGVFIPRRDTGSRLNAAAGGRLFPGEHHFAKFRVSESDDHLSIAIDSNDGVVCVRLEASVAGALPESSVFGTLDLASRFFEGGSLGYSVTSDAGRYDGLELRCKTWSITPLRVERCESSYFANTAVFPPGSATLDCALLMRGIEHEWHSKADLCCDATAPA